MTNKQEFFDLWAELNGDSDRDAKAEMVGILEEHIEENYKYLENNEELIIQLKSDFESDLPNHVLMEATDVSREVCRRFRYHEGRGVVDKRPSSSRDSIPPSVRSEVEERDNGQCVRCGNESELSLHHIIPLSHGGVNSKNNYATLCQACHKKAHNGNFGTRRMAYDTKDEFWEEFCNE